MAPAVLSERNLHLPYANAFLIGGGGEDSNKEQEKELLKRL